MAKRKTTKEIADRIDPQYFTRPHPLRTWRRRASLGACGLGLAWLGIAFALGDQRPYLDGRVSRAHAFVEEDCAKCHVEAFSALPDAACSACHAAAPHAPPALATDPACASCHREHRGREALQVVADGRCNACHQHHGGVREFAGHPAFRVVDQDQRIRFGHAGHLAPGLAGGPLACNACHVVDASGEAFQPIRFDAHCAACHPLGFDVDHPAARVPHALDAGELKLRLDAFYLGVLREDPARATEAEPRSPVPGRDGSPPPPSWERALEARTNGALRVLLGGGAGCLLCHTEGPEGVAAPSIPRDWMPRARFSHATHRFTACSHCHDLSGNDRATVSALPKIATCRECHALSGARTSCTTCHLFHADLHPPPAGTARVGRAPPVR